MLLRRVALHASQKRPSRHCWALQLMSAMGVQMAQKQGALAALQSEVAAVGRSNEGNTSQIAQLQGAMASLQTQRLDLQRADISGRLAVLQYIAAQASLNAAANVRAIPCPTLLPAFAGSCREALTAAAHALLCPRGALCHTAVSQS